MDLGFVDQALAGMPRLTPRQADVSALAVQELVRLLREPGAVPRTSLLPPEWADPAQQP